MASTTFSPQAVMNTLNGTAPTAYTVQGVANLGMGYSTARYTYQYILNTNLGLAPTALSEQRALWATLQSELSLTGSDTAYSVQALLNMALEAGLTLPYVIGSSSSVGLPGGGGGGTTGQPIGLLLSLTRSS